MIRNCNGQDPNLTREMLRTDFNPGTMTESPNWGFRGNALAVVINCQCGATFDDVTRMTVYPHEEV
jgi:hypothetical protein